MEFVTKGNQKAGLKLAIRTALMSPNFLYRFELGMTQAQYETHNAQLTQPGSWLFDEYDGSDFHENYISGPTLENSEVPAYSVAYLEHDFTGNDLIKFSLLAQTDNQEAQLLIADEVIWSGQTSQMTTIELSYSGD